MDTRLHFSWNALFVIDLMCSGQALDVSFSLSLCVWVSEFVFIRADLWKICRFAIKCLPIRLLYTTKQAHTHTNSHLVKIRKEYFKCLNMARRKSYGKYLLTDHQSIALHVYTYRILYKDKHSIAAHTLPPPPPHSTKPIR